MPRHHQDHPVLGERLVDSLDGLFPVHEERDDHVREDNDVRQRQNRQRLGDGNLLVFLCFFWFVSQYFHGFREVTSDENHPVCTFGASTPP